MSSYRLRELAMLSVVTFCAGGMVYAQEGWRDRDHDRDDAHRNRVYNDRGYEDGVRQGQHDRGRSSRYNYQTSPWQRGDAGYRDAYRRGYEQGYNQGNSGGGYPYPNGTYTGGYGRNYPYSSQRGYSNQALNLGLQDGRMDGQNDRATGHSYRPTEDSNYKHADRGYNSAYGNKDSYKQEYRNGYLQGYQQGYGNQGYGAYRR